MQTVLSNILLTKRCSIKDSLDRLFVTE